eukprot:scaffold2753_cov115-Isochrysis_galbana.AAC.11
MKRRRKTNQPPQRSKFTSPSKFRGRCSAASIHLAAEGIRPVRSAPHSTNARAAPITQRPPPPPPTSLSRLTLPACFTRRTNRGAHALSLRVIMASSFLVRPRAREAERVRTRTHHGCVNHLVPAHVGWVTRGLRPPTGGRCSTEQLGLLLRGRSRAALLIKALLGGSSGWRSLSSSGSLEKVVQNVAHRDDSDHLGLVHHWKVAEASGHHERQAVRDAAGGRHGLYTKPGGGFREAPVPGGDAGPVWPGCPTYTLALT